VAELPGGTVTFLFTDVEGSTRLVEELGEHYADVLAAHRSVLREVFERHRGVEVDTQGDAFFVAFARASNAVAAADDAQRILKAAPVPVRIGIHTGEPVVTDEGYVGIDVHRAARICAAGHGGQTLLSQATRDLLDRTVELRDLGEHRLKDLSAPQRLYQFGDEEFPPLKTMHRSNLPIQPTPLIGRRQELAEAGELLSTHRLLTLVGPGGTGKTRLALQLAAETIEEFEDGVWWVPLGALTDSGLVAASIAETVGATHDLVDHLRSKHALVLLDNFEQVLQAAPQVAELLREAPDVKALVTSRAPLRLAGEQEYAVEPLPQHDAVTLFRERAREVKPGFDGDPAVAEICRRLDGLPLALVLAAARIRVLPPAKILERLGHRLPFLTGGARDTPERQRTLRATIEWSYELLREDEKQLFGRLALFAGGFSPAAAEELCAAGLDTLEALVEKSLLGEIGEGRFYMLETIREYALECLDTSGEAETLRQAHAKYFLSVAESAGPYVKGGPRQVEELRRLHAEHQNLRAALAWSSEHDHELHVRLVISLSLFWFVGGGFGEVLQWAGAAVTLMEGGSAELRRKALSAACAAACFGGQLEEARSYAEDALHLAERSGDPAYQAKALSDLAMVAGLERRYDQARALLEARLAIERELGDPWSIATTLNNLGYVALIEGDYERGAAYCTESRRRFDEIGDRSGIVRSLVNLGFATLERAETGDAARLFDRSLVLAREIGDAHDVGYALLGLAAIALEGGDARRAASLLGAADGLTEQVAASLEPVEQRVRARTEEATRVEMGAKAFSRAWLEGRERAGEFAATPVH
jgi:predicted ATPase